MQNTENKTKKFVVLATYVVAVLCLLAGLFLPLYAGKNILALKLLEVFKSLLNKESDPGLTHKISLFGIESLSFDFIALVLVLYAVITALALLSFIPVAFSVRKEGKAAKKFYYGIEIAAVIVLSLFFVVTLQSENVNYNMVVALGGTALALLTLSGLDKGKNSAIKIVLFLLSAIGFLTLFDITLVSEKLSSPFNGKLASAWVSDLSGAHFLDVLFADKISNYLNESDIKNKVLILSGAITATVVLLNLILDTVKLATNKDKNFGRIFDIVRYGIEVVAAACVLVFVFVCKETIGLMLIVVLAVALIQLAIVIIRFILGLRKKPDNERSLEDVDENSNTETPNEETAPTEEPKAEETNSQPYDDGYAPPEEDGYLTPEQDYRQLLEESESLSETAEQPEETKEAQPEESAQTDDVKTEPEEPVQSEEQNSEEIAKSEKLNAEPEDGITEFYEPEEDTTYLLPVEKPAAEEVEEQPEEEPAEEVEDQPEQINEPVNESEKVEEPAEEVPAAEEIKAEPEKEPEKPAPAPYNPYRDEIKPYNPYEKHNNPFRSFEQPAQPYNPYAQNTQTAKPAQPTYEKPEPKPEVKPVQTFRPEQTTERPHNVRPLQPRPIIQEFKPVPPISEQPPKEPNVYTIDTIYAGPTDEFIRKLSNDERIEFARTFIEKNRGDLGNIPDYVVGGDNKKFFSVAFIYLGRIRGLVSDGLLNKMYKELNML